MRITASLHGLLRSLLLGGVVVVVAGPASPAMAADGHGLLLDKHCVDCHNATDWAGGLAFDTLDADNPAADAEVWEKAIRKLRGRLMPPPGKDQPDQQNIDRFVTWLETSLDRAAAANPDPGSVVLHRLNRTEYARAIEGLFGFDIDVKRMLPRDVSSDGFDNVAATLKISPAFLDQYIGAARQISRQAVGRPPVKPSSHAYRQDGSDQRAYIPGLPLGTRGGMLIEHNFPADGEYEFNIRDFHFGGSGYVNRIDAPHRVILTIDGSRVFEQQVGGAADLKLVDQKQAGGEAELQARFDHIRVKVKAGQRKVGAAFIARSFAESDSPLQPIAMLPEMERYPTIPGIEISGPFEISGVTDTVSRQRIFICRPASESDELPCARQILRRIAQQAYRRPIVDEDLNAPLAFFTSARKKADFETGIESALTAVLSSTNFLYRAELLPEDAKPGSTYRISDLELASRLSFFLWSQGPDDQLLDLAARSRLSEPKTLEQQIDRMLRDRRSDSLVTNFAFQWLNVNRLDNVVPDPVLYPDFDPDLREGFREELRLFLDSILRADRSVLDLISDDHSFVNERVALQYGIADVRGAQFRRIQLKDPNRFGLFGKGGVLMGTAYGNRTSPVLRGAWILENITGTPPNSPPPGVEQFKETEPGKKAETVRERLERHRQDQSCNACHGVIDPLGFALENFDVVGAWRDKDRDAGTLIDASGVTAGGRPLQGPADLRAAMLARPDQFVQTITEKLLTFALGRNLEYHDMPAVRAIVRRSAGENYRFAAIVKGIVASDAFRMKRVPDAAPAEPLQRTALQQ
jgi:mono/diheme cytochrome c family protein